MKSFLLLLAFLQPLAFAEVPTPAQLELTFILKESLRSPLAATTMFVVPKVLPFSAQLLGAEASLLLNVELMVPSWVTGYSAFTGIQHVKKNKFLSNVMKECASSKTFICIRDDAGKISFLNPQTREEVAFIQTQRKAATIEVQSNPFKLKDMEGQMGEILQASLYQSAKDAGLKNVLVGGKSPIQFEFSSMFGGGKSGKPINYEFFRNYVVDWANHDELYYGALHYAPAKGSAGPLLDTDKKRKAFQNWLKEYDSYLANGQMDEHMFQSMRKSLQEECKFGAGSALNVLSSPETIEVTALRTNKNVEELTRKLTILEARAKFIHQQKGLMPYYDAGAIQSAQDGVDRFHQFLKESKLDWEQYKKVLPSTWQKKVPQELPLAELFARGNTAPGTCFKAYNRIMIHLFGR